jgi:hypothetical protein
MRRGQFGQLAHELKWLDDPGDPAIWLGLTLWQAILWPRVDWAAKRFTMMLCAHERCSLTLQSTHDAASAEETRPRVAKRQLPFGSALPTSQRVVWSLWSTVQRKGAWQQATLLTVVGRCKAAPGLSASLAGAPAAHQQPHAHRPRGLQTRAANTPTCAHAQASKGAKDLRIAPATASDQHVPNCRSSSSERDLIRVRIMLSSRRICTQYPTLCGVLVTLPYAR